MSAATAISVRAFHSPGVSPWSVRSPAARGGIERILGTAFFLLDLARRRPSWNDGRFPRLDPSPSLPGRRCGCLQRRTPARHPFTDPTPPELSPGPIFVEGAGEIAVKRIDVSRMAMTPKPVRFSDWTWAVITRESTAHGISAAEFVRAATLAAAVISARRRGAGDTIELEALLMRAINDRDDA